MKAKKIKQIIAVAASTMMITSLFAVSAFAVGGSFDKTKTTGTVNITDSQNTKATYKAYKVLDATPSGNDYTYEVTPSFASVIGNDKAYKIEGGNIKRTDGEALDSATLANDLARVAVNEKVTGIDLKEGENLRDLPLGYYVVLETDAEDPGYVQKTPILLAVPYVEGEGENKTFDYAKELTVTSKYNIPKVDKDIVVAAGKKDAKDAETVGSIDMSDSSQEVVDANSAKIGDTVTYVVESDVPTYSGAYTDEKVKYVLRDTLDSGLNFKTDTLKVYGYVVENGTWEEVATDAYTPTTTDNAITVDFSGKYGSIKKYSKIRLKYDATLNERAKVGGGANNNKIELDYSNKHEDEDSVKTEEDKVQTYTYGIGVIKVNNENKIETLAGAQFKIKDKGSNSYMENPNPVAGLDKTIFVTDDEGEIKVAGLKEGTYVFEEVKAPEGYVTPANNETTVKITINEGDYANPSYEVNGVAVTNTTDKTVNVIGQVGKLTTDTGIKAVVTNVKGVNLPVTGGAGTWMFTIGGLTLMAGATIVFVSTKKKRIK